MTGGHMREETARGHAGEETAGGEVREEIVGRHLRREIPGRYVREGSIEHLLAKLRDKRKPVVFYLEPTIRCNNDCRHCYNNLPAGDAAARKAELSSGGILEIARQAAELGVLYCVVSGGEPVLRPDFGEIYLGLTRLGLLVTVFTNACLVTPEHVELFRRYPPERVEVTVYGVTSETYERVSRRSGSYAAFRRGLDLLLAAGVPLALKCTAVRSNLHELRAIAEFCRRHSTLPGRLSSVLLLRADRDPDRNRGIAGERLSAREIAEVAAPAGRILERDRDAGRFDPIACSRDDGGLFRCNAGKTSFAVDAGGAFRLCSMLVAPGTVLDLRDRGAEGGSAIRPGAVAEGWNRLAVRLRALRPGDPVHLSRCGGCTLAAECFGCPAFSDLEGKGMDGWSEYFCDATRANARARASSIPAANA